MMKRFLTLLLVFSVLGGGAFVFAQDREHGMGGGEKCAHCGMDLGMLGSSAMSITYSDGSVVKACSIRCAALDLAINLDRTPSTIMASDYYAKTAIDAEKAFWVIGGNAKGVMTSRPKWAFADKTGADKFIAENGGQAATFETAMKAACEDLYTDAGMLRKMREMKSRHGMGH